MWSFLPQPVIVVHLVVSMWSSIIPVTVQSASVGAVLKACQSHQNSPLDYLRSSAFDLYEFVRVSLPIECEHLNDVSSH